MQPTDVLKSETPPQAGEGALPVKDFANKHEGLEFDPQGVYKRRGEGGRNRPIPGVSRKVVFWPSHACAHTCTYTNTRAHIARDKS